MTTEFVGLKKEMTVGQALDYIRRVALDKETIYNCYVTDETRRLEGLITARVLLTSPTDHVIGDLMETNVISVKTTDDKEEVGRMLAKYDFLALPVVDSEERLVGIVTYDDAMDVISEETEEDFAIMAAITPSETPYLKTPVLRIFKTRIPWLMLLMLTSTVTGMIISSFESALAAKVILTMFIPMLMDTGGNCGSQSSITVIRALSLGEVGFADTLRVLFKRNARSPSLQRLPGSSGICKNHDGRPTHQRKRDYHTGRRSGFPYADRDCVYRQTDRCGAPAGRQPYRTGSGGSRKSVYHDARRHHFADRLFHDGLVSFGPLIFPYTLRYIKTGVRIKK